MKSYGEEKAPNSLATLDYGNFYNKFKQVRLVNNQFS